MRIVESAGKLGGNGDAGEGVPQLVRMQSRYVVPLGESLHIPFGRLRVHRLRAVLLGKDIRTERLRRLLLPQLEQQPDDRRVHINRAGLAAFRRVKIDALLRQGN